MKGASTAARPLTGMDCSTSRPRPGDDGVEKPLAAEEHVLHAFIVRISTEQVASIMARLPLSTIMLCPRPSSYSTAAPSISRKAVPEP